MVAVCDACSRRCKNECGLRLHKRNVHNRDVNTKQAADDKTGFVDRRTHFKSGCSSPTQIKLGLRSSQIRTTEPDVFMSPVEASVSVVACNICRKRCKNIVGLRVHTGLMHKPWSAAVVCDICEKRFKNDVGLLVHKGIMHKSLSADQRNVTNTATSSCSTVAKRKRRTASIGQRRKGKKITAARDMSLIVPALLGPSRRKCTGTRRIDRVRRAGLKAQDELLRQYQSLWI